jgi:hypothetical protein
MLNRYVGLLCMLLSILFSGCYILEPDEPVSDVLQPLAVGNWWEYEILRPQWPNPHQGTVREIVSEKLNVHINGVVYPTVAWNADINWEDFPEYKWLARNGDEGLYLMGGIAETDTFFMNELQYKYPAEVGESWQAPRLAFSRFDFKFYIADTLEVTLVDINKEVNAPAGNFRCYVYYFRVPIADDVLGYFGYYQFYSPRLGLVRQEEWAEHPSGNVEEHRLLSQLSLIDYHLVR